MQHYQRRELMEGEEKYPWVIAFYHRQLWSVYLITKISKIVTGGDLILTFPTITVPHSHFQ